MTGASSPSARQACPGWLSELIRRAEAGEGAVVVTLARVRGSTPREAGARMIVAEDGFFGTIGGGHLEYRCLEIARGILRDLPGERLRRMETFPLGPALGQCCGGSADVLFEAPAEGDIAALEGDITRAWPDRSEVLVTPLDADGGPMHLRRRRTGEDLPNGPLIAGEKARKILLENFADERSDLLLFGAGHVGRAVVAALAPLPFRIAWIDSRSELFPGELPANARAAAVDSPGTEIEYAPSGAFYLVMTHSHQLDLELCESVLRRGDFAYLGLIGSDTKRARFQRRLKARGLSADSLERLVCPIGIGGISGKRPAEIAASVAAQLLVLREHRQQRGNGFRPQEPEEGEPVKNDRPAARDRR